MTAPAAVRTEPPRDEYGESLARAAILVIDDEPGMRNFLMKTLGARCRHVEQARSCAEAGECLDHGHFDLVILDNIMPDKTGLDWLEEQRRVGLFAETILITAYADLDTAIKALRAGVTDFVLKPFRANQILNAVARALDRKYLARDNYLLRHELSGGGGTARGRLLGHSPAIREVRELLARLAPMPTPVLFTGASGTGKEIAARTLHGLSERADKPFVAVNCAAISDEHIAEELFGVIDDGKRRKDGLLFHAEGGTLLLDEVAQLPRGCRRRCCACWKTGASAPSARSARCRSTCGSCSPPMPISGPRWRRGGSAPTFTTASTSSMSPCPPCASARRTSRSWPRSS